MRNLYILMHQDDPAAALLLDDDGKILRMMPIRPELLPFRKMTDLKRINVWWSQRCIPEKRSDLKKLLEESGCASSASLMVRNLALSLTDTYWIRPESMENLTWEQVNLFDSTDDRLVLRSPYGEEFTRNPSATLNGSLEKTAFRREDGWYLEKKGDTEDGQQNVNELAASVIHRSQDWDEYVPYLLHKGEDGTCVSCESRIFTGKTQELVTAYEMAEMEKRSNDVSVFEQIIRTACALGLDGDYVREFLDYQILFDFVITNTDRHLYNFGALRDPETMRFTSMAPIYDSGNSMFFRDPFAAVSRESILKIRITSLKEKEEQMLKLITDRSLIRADLLPSPKEILEIYLENGIPEEKAKLISTGYQKKAEMLREFQQGVTISLYQEKRKKRPGTIT